MIETTGDLWQLGREFDAIVITTNGAVTKKGEAVMGKGCALEAKRKLAWLPKRLGEELIQHGNHVHVFTASFEQGETKPIVTFPVKHTWHEKASMPLIGRSIDELVELTDQKGWTKVIMPRPGCGNGGLQWNIVRALVATLDNRFFVTTYA